MSEAARQATRIDNSGNAFPVPIAYNPGTERIEDAAFTCGQGGMTYRQWLSGQALVLNRDNNPERCAAKCLELADAVIAAACGTNRELEAKNLYAALTHGNPIPRFDSSPSMDIDTKPGSKVRFCFLTSGHNIEVYNALDHLKPGHIYTVREMDVGDSSSRVYLDEVPDHGFNSVLFANAPEAGGAR